MKRLILVMTLMLGLCAGILVWGNTSGNMTEITFETEMDGSETVILEQNYDAIAVSSGINLVIAENIKEIMVEWSGTTRPQFDLNVSGNTLKISQNNTGRRNVRMTVYVPHRQYKKVDVSSGSRVTFQNYFRTGSLEINCSSGSRIDGKINSTSINLSLASGSKATLSGKCTELSVKNASGSNSDLYDMVAEKVRVQASSGSSVKVHAIREISVSASSGSSVKYKGNPTVKSRDVSSGASFKNI